MPPNDKAGPFFAVDDVDAFYATNEGKLSFNAAPKNIPPGRYVSFDDPWGNRVHVLDMSASRDADRVAGRDADRVAGREADQ